ncbi:ferrous iron transporter B [Phycisphaerales bacterium]|nr:ferrous iron transporter B [Phycisphaerales bacterium]RPG19529.1 MAG: ferrous iron transporter B [Phycisphaera sp. TMED9]
MNDHVRTPSSSQAPARQVALIGNPNTGKTTLFNRLCGLRARTANYPGSTAEMRIGRCDRGDQNLEIVDLPGIYGMDLDLPESRMCRDCLDGRLEETPDAILVVIDATAPARGISLAIAAIARRLPTVVALNMADLAARRGLSFDEERLASKLGVPVVAISGRTGRGMDALIEAIHKAIPGHAVLPLPSATNLERRAWIDEAIAESMGGHDAVGSGRDSVFDRLDKAFTHPILGLVVFVGVMGALFWTIFSLAGIPMDLIDVLFEKFGGLAAAILPEGPIRDLMVDGIIGGVAGTVVFLPQILILFFLLALLEDTGYLARAAFVMDRVMCRFGLPGQAFVPMLSSHACALPGIMSARLVPDRDDRLATILVAPFMSCTARLPVYVLLIGLLFDGSPWLAGFAFAGCYLLGAAAALISALIARRTILPGRSRPMVLELPAYRRPSIRNAILVSWDRGMVFLKNAGTIILGIVIVMWWLSAYPKAESPDAAIALRTEAAEVMTADPVHSEELEAQAERIELNAQQSGSFAGQIGTLAQPLFAPLGADRTLTVGILTSFLAREVFVSSLAVLQGGGSDVDDDESVLTLVRDAKRPDGSRLFNTATAASMLVFFVLAMQCLPTLAVTRRETGSWKWPALQFAWMTGLAWVFSAIVFAVVTASTTA